MNIVLTPISDLTLDPNNARKHSDKNLKAIAASLDKFGQRKPIVVHRGVVIAGNGTVEAAKSLGWKDITVAEVPEEWDANTAKAYALADNRSAELAEWDEGELAKQLIELMDSDWNITELGFDVPALADIEPNSDEDEIPEPPVEPKTKLGDIYQLGRHRLMCGDSTDSTTVERLMNGAKADMVFTDPPYGVNYDGGHATEKRRDKLQNDDAVNMYDLPIKNAFKFSKDESPLYLWFADRFAQDVITGLTEAGWIVRNWIIWNKNVAQFGAIGAQYKSKHEPCIYAFKKGKSANWVGPNNEITVWDISRDHKNEHHPTQKPVELAKRAMGNHAVKEVLDLFGGSGSTLIAAEQTNRTCYMMELDLKYCDVIVTRWENLTGLKAELLNSK
jgi:site-specific DNA-methyltransferase (adenine-specific)